MTFLNIQKKKNENQHENRNTKIQRYTSRDTLHAINRSQRRDKRNNEHPIMMICIYKNYAKFIRKK